MSHVEHALFETVQKEAFATTADYDLWGEIAWFTDSGIFIEIIKINTTW